MDLSYLAESFLLLTLMSGGLYLVFRILFSRSIVSISDPLNLWIALLSFYLAGSLILLNLITVNASYIYVVGLIFLYVFSAAIFSYSRVRPSSPELVADKTDQLLFAILLAGMLVANLVVNQIFGIIPLLAGAETRSELGTVAVPTLEFLAPDISIVLTLILVLTKYPSVKRVALCGVATSIISTILNGSKSSIFFIVYIFIIINYILHLRKSADDSEEDQLALRRQLRRSKLTIIVIGSLTALILPAYLIFLGVDGGAGDQGAIRNLSVRLFGGFDALAGIAIKDIDITNVTDVNLREFYFFPFYKAIYGPPEFQSAGQYLIYQLTGNYNFAATGLNPNSNYAIELIMSTGNIFLSSVLVVVTCALIFSLRKRLIRKSGLRIFDLVLWCLIVLSPFSQLLDGTYFFIRTYELLAVYLMLNTLVILGKGSGTGRFRYRLL